MTWFETIAVAENLPAVTAFVRNALRDLPLDREYLLRIDLAVEEVFLNIAKYAFPPAKPGRVTISCSDAGTGSVLLEFVDDGKEFDPLGQKRPDLNLSIADRPIGGLGLLFIESLTRSRRYSRINGQNRLTLEFAASADERN